RLPEPSCTTPSTFSPLDGPAKEPAGAPAQISHAPIAPAITSAATAITEIPLRVIVLVPLTGTRAAARHAASRFESSSVPFPHRAHPGVLPTRSPARASRRHSQPARSQAAPAPRGLIVRDVRA